MVIANEPAEVVVVGSGMAGSLLAAELAEGGMQVLVLEGGPERTLNDMVSSQIWSRRHRWSGAPTLGEGDLLTALNFAMGWGTGGAGFHWYGNWYRLHEVDFKARSLFGRGLDWPIEYTDLRKYYDQAQTMFGVSGDLQKEIWAPPADPYPSHPLPQMPQTRALIEGFDALDIPTSPNPVAINSRTFDGRRPCLLDGWCDAGCPIGALANPLVVQWPRARKAGVALRHEAHVVRVTTNASGTRATGVDYRDNVGELHHQPADLVIVAASAVPNARLLLLSANAAHENGLANRSNKLGRHYMSHPAVVLFALYDKRPTSPHMGVTGANFLSQHGYDDKAVSAQVFGSRQFMGGQAAKPNDLLGIAGSRPDLYGEALDDFLRVAAQHFANMTILCEETSMPENRIELTSQQTDAFGLPVAKVFNTVPAENAARVELARQEGLEILEAGSASTAWAGDRIAIHEMGGTVMGDNADTSVTNSYGQTHEVENLFIAGSSLFPTSGAVNPTATLLALALRTTEYILAGRSAWRH